MAQTLEQKREYNRKYQALRRANMTEQERNKLREYHREYYHGMSEEQIEKKRIYDKNNSIKRRNSRSENILTFVSIARTQLKSGAKSRGLNFEITKLDILDLIIKSQMRCAISGVPLNTRKKNPFLASVDRIDSSRGYSKDNIQLVCNFINTAKMNHSDEFLIAFCKQVAEHNQNKSCNLSEFVV